MTVDPAILQQAPTPYSQARPLIRNGDIALFKGKEPFSQLIQTFTKGPFSHVGLIWRMDDIDRVMLLESVDHLGVRLIPLSTKLNGNGAEPPYDGQMAIARHADFPDGVADSAHPRIDRFVKMISYAVDRVGSPYSAADIVDIATRIMFGFAGLKEAGDLVPKGAYICSEYAYECYKAIGIEIPFNAEGFVSPNDFARDPRVSGVAHVGPDG